MNHWNRRGGILSTLLLTFLALIALAVGAVILVVQNVRVQTVHRSSGEDVTIDTPGGRIDIRGRDNMDPSALGIPIYPGAKRTKDGGGATFAWTSAEGDEEKGLSVAGADLYTPDSVQQVIDYYRGQLPNWIIVTDRHGQTRMEYTHGGYKRIIAIRSKGDGTHIGVASIGEPASN